MWNKPFALDKGGKIKEKNIWNMPSFIYVCVCVGVCVCVCVCVGRLACVHGVERV
jgi:hypothetical protein